MEEITYRFDIIQNRLCLNPINDTIHSESRYRYYNKRTLTESSASFFRHFLACIYTYYIYAYYDYFVQNSEYKKQLLTIPHCCVIMHT